MSRLQWETLVPLWRNRFILQGLGLAIGLPLAMLVLVLLALRQSSLSPRDFKYALILLGAWLGLTFCLVTLLYGGKYAPGFIVDETGVTNYTHPAQAKVNRLINTLLVTVGPLGSKGAGLMAQSRQALQIKWRDVTGVSYYPREHTILLRGGFASKMAVFCTPENYTQVAAMVTTRLAEKQGAARR